MSNWTDEELRSLRAMAAAVAEAPGETVPVDAVRLVALVDEVLARRPFEDAERLADTQARIAELAEDFHTGITLRLTAVNRDLVEDPNVRILPGSGVKTLVVRDDLGRTLDVAGIAYGPPCDETWPWRVTGDYAPDDIIVSNAPLDASKTYLVIAVEHPDEVPCG